MDSNADTMEKNNSDSRKGCNLFCCNKEPRENVKCPNIFEKVNGKLLPKVTELGKNEAKRVATIFWPVSCNHFLIFFIPMSSVLFLGRLGKTSLAAGGLGLSITNVTGLSIGFGMALGLDTLMNQAMGAKNPRRVGILLQRAILILGIALLPIYALLINIKQILIAIKQDPGVAGLTEEFIYYYFPAIAFNALYQILEKFLVCQKLVRPLILSSLLGVVVNCLSCYIFVIAYPLGMKGGAIAIDLAYLSMCIYLLIAIKAKGWHKDVWQGWSWECLEGWGEFLKFSLPTLAMICIEWWSFEAGTLVIGTQGDVQLAAQVITFNIAAVNFMFCLGFAVAATVQVGHYLGAGRPGMAILASRIAMCYTLFCGMIVMIILLIARNYVGYIFTKDAEVIALTASVVPFTAVFGILDGFQCLCGGIIRGAGIQKIGVLVNLIGYAIALPLAIVLCIVVKLLIKGMWTGLAVGLVVQCTAFTIIIYNLDWKKQSGKAVKRSAVVIRPCRSNSAVYCEADSVSSADGTELAELVESNGVTLKNEDETKPGNANNDQLLYNGIVTKTMKGKDFIWRRLFVLALCLSTLTASIISRFILH